MSSNNCEVNYTPFWKLAGLKPSHLVFPPRTAKATLTVSAKVKVDLQTLQMIQ